MHACLGLGWGVPGSASYLFCCSLMLFLLPINSLFLYYFILITLFPVFFCVTAKTRVQCMSYMYVSPIPDIGLYSRTTVVSNGHRCLVLLRKSIFFIEEHSYTVQGHQILYLELWSKVGIHFLLVYMGQIYLSIAIMYCMISVAADFWHSNKLPVMQLLMMMMTKLWDL